METRLKSGTPLQQKTPCLVLTALEGKVKSPLFKEIDQALDGALARAVRDGEFSGKHCQTLLLHPGEALAADRILLVGLGKEKGAGQERLRQAAGTAAALLQERGVIRFVIDVDSVPISTRHLNARHRLQALAEGTELASYRFTRYRTEGSNERPAPIEAVTLLVEKKSQVTELQPVLEESRHICQGVTLTRDLVNEPGNVKSPDFLARTAESLAREIDGLTCTVLDKAAIEKEKMNALLGVAQGSVREPRLIILEYRGEEAGAHPIALIGKGVVFDAGGISLKPAEKMDEMKMDMGGGATVIGTLATAARLKLPVNLVGIVPAVENLPSGSAIRPGDILTSMSGKTIEVLNTDAEGRLILADALTYASRFNPRVVIDLATLTGACIIALGHHATAVLGNHDGLVRQLIKAGEQSGERLWQLPLWEDYSTQIKSDIADVKNIGGRPAGTITAAAFLSKFAGDYTWAHLDIAGTAWEEKGRPYTPKGATGVGVRLLIEYLR